MPVAAVFSTAAGILRPCNNMCHARRNVLITPRAYVCLHRGMGPHGPHQINFAPSPGRPFHLKHAHEPRPVRRELPWGVIEPPILPTHEP